MEVTPELITELFLTMMHPTVGLVFVLPRLIFARFIMNGHALSSGLVHYC